VHFLSFSGGDALFPIRPSWGGSLAVDSVTLPVEGFLAFRIWSGGFGRFFPLSFGDEVFFFERLFERCVFFVPPKVPCGDKGLVFFPLFTSAEEQNTLPLFSQSPKMRGN